MPLRSVGGVHFLRLVLGDVVSDLRRDAVAQLFPASFALLRHKGLSRPSVAAVGHTMSIVKERGCEDGR
uniref:Uncharacterized protein n=1 Tax=Rhodococcus sp. NS1 TaxID=402236 RepID=Q06GA7_9NOCA|nr:hypothetical protein PNSL1.076 [Rhodococcus sp. NS1]